MLFEFTAFKACGRTAQRIPARIPAAIVVVAMMALAVFSTHRATAAAGAADDKQYSARILPVFKQFCFDCHGGGRHKGDVALDAFPNVAAMRKDRKTWDKVLHHVRTREMPPEDKPQPTMDQRQAIVSWIERDLFPVDCRNPDPGRVTIRRLNRAEYNNTIRDLVGVDFKPADNFPADDVGNGFDNMGDVLSMPPLLVEKYMVAADKVLAKAIQVPDAAHSQFKRYATFALDGTALGDAMTNGGRSFSKAGELSLKHEFPADGMYLLRAMASGQPCGKEPPRMALRYEGKDLQQFDVKALEGKPLLFTARFQAKKGAGQLAVAFLNTFYDALNPDPKRRERMLFVDYLEVVSLNNPAPTNLPGSHKRIFLCEPDPEHPEIAARRIITAFATRAFRRPVSAAEVDRLMPFVEMALAEGESFEQGIKLALKAVLVSPHFLFRGETNPSPDNPAATRWVDDYALASRLSYFLWSTMPDERLMKLAGRKALRRNLEAEVRRMLADPKARAWVENFAGQWLQLRGLKVIQPDPELFPEFDEELRAAMLGETEMSLEYVIREDRSVIEWLNADYTFLNERLAKHYGMESVKGDAFRKVGLSSRQRGGLVTHASILTLTSNPTRTSPVKRGKWVLDNLLGQPPPPPPADVPDLKETKEAVLSGSLRQRMEQHRDNALCASCHARMDPLGFGLENYDTIGAWRDVDGKFPIDPAGQLVSGEKFQGPVDLKDVLVNAKQAAYVQCLAEKTLTYALGRGLEYYDRCAVEGIVKNMTRNKYRFSSLIQGVVDSVPFQKLRGEAALGGQTAGTKQ